MPYLEAISGRFIRLPSGFTTMLPSTTANPAPGRFARSTPKPMGTNNKGSYCLKIPMYNSIPEMTHIRTVPQSTKPKPVTSTKLEKNSPIITAF